MYITANEYFQKTFGCKVYKLSLDGGFTCPNRDGTLGTGGCIFCSGMGSGEFSQAPCDSVAQQLEQAKSRVRSKLRTGKYLAYFQSFTTTYAPVSVLENLYTQAIAPEYIVGLSIGTRPDCLSLEILDLLRGINQKKPVIVELGLQTVKPESISYIRRGYENHIYFDAVKKLKAIGVHVVTHIILGLPGETVEDAINTTQQAVLAGTDGVKFHLLHVLRDTDLAKDYEKGLFQCLSLEEYAGWLKACLSVLPSHIVVHRITGDGAKRDLVAPAWSADKKRVLNYLNNYLAEPN